MFSNWLPCAIYIYRRAKNIYSLKATPIDVKDKAGVKKVFLLKNAHKLFNKNYKKNIIGRQFVG
jgi:hypothetical protein